jgi:hypothetical protein
VCFVKRGPIWAGCGQGTKGQARTVGTVDLLVLTSLDQLLLTLQRLFTFNKTSYLNEEQAILLRRSIVPSLPLQ